MSVVNLVVNGRRQTVDVDPATPLLYVLTDDLELAGPKFGCGLGQCGSCTVLIGGRAMRSCITPVSAVNGARDYDPRGARDAGEAASHSAGLHRRAGSPVRVLFERRHSHREGVSGSAAEGDRHPNPAGAVHRLVPLLRAHADVQGHQALSGNIGMRITPEARSALNRAGFSRRDFLRGAGALIVTYSAAPIDRLAFAQGQFGTRVQSVDPKQLDSVDRRGRGRDRDGLHGKGRARPGHLHGADAARRRRALRAALPRAAHPGRHVYYARIRGRHQAASRRPSTSTRRVWRWPGRPHAKR